ncbi:MAG: ferrous iron transporter B [Elusimicrobia bacterium]|nr:ferrous iron transporter B [Elusimicrobiota bacterium]
MKTLPKKILLIGNPNVGKSVIFSRLTGANVIVSNYPGTTVEFTEGLMRIDGEDIRVIDIPGIYALDPISEADKVAVRMLDESNPEDTVIINVVDATNLERNLNLTLQLLKRKIPMLVVLNLWDECQHSGIEINPDIISKIIGVPCVTTCGISGEGIKNLVDELSSAKISDFKYKSGERWNEIGKIIEKAQKISRRRHRFTEVLSDLTVNPFTGIPFALIVGFISFWLIRLMGEGLIEYVAEPLFDRLWLPVMERLSVFLGGSGFIHSLVVGDLIGGAIDFEQSFGLFTTGLFVPLGVVLPYVFSFYFILSILEDTGYLPRLAVLVDNGMHRVGLHGFGIIPMLVGFGCNVPGALSTRIMETRRERFIAMTLMAIGIPCTAQIAVVAGLLGEYGAGGLFPVFLTLFIVWVSLGVIMNKLIKGTAPELFLEIPPYRLPYFKGLLKKVWMRIVWFLKEAIPWVLFGVLLINLMFTFGIIDFIGRIFQPIISGLLGLPEAATGALLVGVLRKDVAVGMLAPLAMTKKELIIASVVLTTYFPCAATFAVLLKEFGLKDMLKATLIMITVTLIVGTSLNLIL